MGFISRFLGNMYAKHLMNIPSFVAKVDEANKNGAERVVKMAQIRKQMDDDWDKIPAVIQFDECVEECHGNRKEAATIHRARINLMREYDVTWEIAKQSLNNKTAVIAKQLRDEMDALKQNTQKGT